MEIREAEIKDATFYVEHSERLFASNGKDGLIFSPRVAGSYKASTKDIESVESRWSKELADLGFERAWLLWDKDQVVGHTLLRSGQLDSMTHRLDLQIGIEEKYRKNGVGKELTSIAVSWAKSIGNIEWIDLAVFSENEPAINLYKSFGFKEVGRIEDRFRVHGKSVDNIFMVLKIIRNEAS